jgi:inner membrane protein
VAASVLPDADVLAFRFGVPYAAALGHRGFTHSITFALALALLGAVLSRPLRTAPSRAFVFLFVATISHALLDALTTGGLGVALLWPFSAERFFAPVQVIAVSPISLSRFLTDRGLAVLRSELLWVWLPAVALTAALALARRGRPATRP